MDTKKWDKKQLRKIKALYKKNPDSKLFFPLAKLYEKQDEINTAKELLENGLEKYPNYYGAKAFLGEVLYKTNDLEGAISQLEDVIKNVPDNLLSYKILAKIYAKQGKNELAEERLKVAAIITPDHPETPSIDQIVEEFTPSEDKKTDTMDTEKFDEESKKEEKLKRKRKEKEEEESAADEILTTTLAELYFSQGMIDKAIDIYTKLVAKDPGNKGLERRLTELRAESGLAPADDRQEAKRSVEPGDSFRVERESSSDKPENKPQEKEAESSPEIDEIPIEQEELAFTSAHNETEQEDPSIDYYKNEKILITLQAWIDTIHRIKHIRGQL